MKENDNKYKDCPEKNPDNIIVMKNITRVFGTLVANDNVTLELRKKEIHALLGENGAGKSTLMSVLFGLYPPTEGHIYLNGKEIQVKSPRHATELGIGMVHQHFMLIERFTALENIVLGFEDTKFGFLVMKQAREKLDKLMKDYGLYVDLDKKISEMSVSMQQKVEILKMLYKDSNVLIFDEPTAVLTEMEIEELMKIILRLRDEGKAILFISHKLNEVRQISNRVSVLRKGKYIGTYLTKDYDNDALAELMVGKKVNFKTDKTPAHPTDVVLDVQHLNVIKSGTKKLAVDDFSLKVRKGEIVAVAGIDGNGQDEIVEAITGLVKPLSGHIFIEGQDLTTFNIKQRNNLGLDHIPADRHKHGLVLDYNVMYNMVLHQVDENEFSKNGVLKKQSIQKYSDELVHKYDIRSSMGSHTITRGMSGGNQQKVIVAREIERKGDLLIAVQPTRGLDVGAIETIHKEIVKARDDNRAVLLVSLEIDEVFNLADTIYTIYEGKITGKFKPEETTFKEIGLYETGAKCQPEFKREKQEGYEELIAKAIEESQPFKKFFNNAKKRFFSLLKTTKQGCLFVIKRIKSIFAKPKEKEEIENKSKEEGKN